MLDGLPGVLTITMSLGSQVGDGPVETHDSGHDETNHPGSENGWARLSDSLPVRSAGDMPIIADRRCNYSICFCKGMGDCRPPVQGPDDYPRTYTKEGLAHERHRKHPREELEVGRSERDPYIGLKRAKASDIRRLLAEIGRQAQQSRELFVWAQDLQDRLWTHRVFGEEIDYDYDSDNGDT